MGKRLFEYSLAIILLTMESYLELKQYKWIIMLMAQFGFKIWWQAVFLDDNCYCITAALTQVLFLLCTYVGLYVHMSSLEMSDVLSSGHTHSNMSVCAVSSDPTSSLPPKQINQTPGQTSASCDVCYELLNMSIFISILHVNLGNGTPAFDINTLPGQCLFCLTSKQKASLLSVADDAGWP